MEWGTIIGLVFIMLGFFAVIQRLDKIDGRLRDILVEMKENRVKR